MRKVQASARLVDAAASLSHAHRPLAETISLLSVLTGD
jgi:hypothetical protein